MKRDRTVTFKTERGSFVIPARAFEDGREHELAVTFAKGLPEDCTTVDRRMQKDGSAVITWRKVHVIEVKPGKAKPPRWPSSLG